MTTRLEHAIREARRIRRDLKRLGRAKDLGGDCCCASLLLADALGGPQSLRVTYSASTTHVWNVVDGVIIDITATQFNADEDAVVRGVLVTREPRFYHRPVTLWGRSVARFITEDMWDAHDALCRLVIKRGVIDRMLAPRERMTA